MSGAVPTVLDESDKSYDNKRGCFATGAAPIRAKPPPTRTESQMAILTKTARTILRSRIRRHRDAVLIGQHINGEYGVTNVAGLTKDQLLATAAKFNVLLPDTDECDAYDTVLTGGYTGAEALAAADAHATGKNPSGPMMLVTPVNPGQAVSPVIATAVGTDADDADTEDDDDEEVTITSAAPSVAHVASTGTDAETEKAIEADVQSLMQMMATGNFAGYQDGLKRLAREARKPARVEYKTVAPIDPSKIKGHVPTVTGAKTMAEAGVPNLGGARMDATKLPTYDTPDAPTIDPHYNWHPQTAVILSVFRRGQPVFGYGPAGTGKTEFAKQVAARWGRRFVRISCDDQTEAQTLVGMTVPDKDGGVKWQDGQLTAAIRVPGAVILIDEPSVARPGALFVLQAVMDSDKKIHIAETGEVVHVAPDVIIMLADNTNGTGDTTGQYEATRRLNRATLDRPDAVIRFDYMTPVEETNVIAAKTGLKKQAAALLARFGALTRAKADEGKLAHPVGLRRLLAMAAMLADGVDPTTAFQTAVVEGAPYDDKEPLRQFWTADVDTNKLKQAA
ncbi:MAG: AAA family ATPase [Devosia sp.]|nr:AAA family ATPase [Devosia sp.]